MAHERFAGLSVPNLIATPTDVSRLRREVQAVDEYLRSQQLRTPGEPMSKLPKTSRLLDELTSANQLNLLDGDTRQHIAEFLADVAKNAPVVHISFASDPSSAFMQKIVTWFRENVHPSVLIRVGLQPGIAAGCVVRTTNKYFDLSLRHHLLKERRSLVEALHSPVTVTAPEPRATVTAAAAEGVAE